MTTGPSRPEIYVVGTPFTWPARRILLTKSSSFSLFATYISVFCLKNVVTLHHPENWALSTCTRDSISTYYILICALVSFLDLNYQVSRSVVSLFRISRYKQSKREVSYQTQQWTNTSGSSAYQGGTNSAPVWRTIWLLRRSSVLHLFSQWGQMTLILWENNLSYS